MVLKYVKFCSGTVARLKHTWYRSCGGQSMEGTMKEALCRGVVELTDFQL